MEANSADPFEWKQTVQTHLNGSKQCRGRAESELQKAAQNANVGSKALDEQILKFESQKLKDLKNVLQDFVHVEMVFHAKALEYYSRCFESICHISVDMDLEEFERKLQASRSPGWQAMMLNQSLTSGSGMSSTQASGFLTSPDNTGSFGESTTSLEKRVGFTGVWKCCL
ncbi:hypothetical protein CHS0354_022750 [Potamilus streckersoni]|uniref:Protein FAM92B n=1 Tax=Potamilus streckersoni TaxID=2493646 RepID=A0AAE0RT87_9BIVA|nr:hypothetical protein CHS0354_022750 [Potamilus streckersoni]